MSRFTVCIVLFVSLSACGGQYASPTLPGATAIVFSLSGTVYGSTSEAVPEASVKIIDGIHRGETRTTDDAGKFSFTDLTPSAFMLQASKPADGYRPQNIGVNLTANRVVNFYYDH